MITQAGHGTVPAWREHASAAGAQLLLLALLTQGVGLGPVGWLVGIAYIAAIWSLLGIALHRFGSHALGPADRVTLARAVLVGGVTALVTDRAGEDVPVVVLVALASAALVLDAVDGWVARRTGTASPLGARFDMEVDAFLILVLSVHASLSIGMWVMVIGSMRYAFVAAAWVAPWLRAPLPPRFARKTVAALQGIVLVLVSAGFLPNLVATALVGIAMALLAWSFGLDIGWLWRNRHADLSWPKQAEIKAVLLTKAAGFGPVPTDRVDGVVPHRGPVRRHDRSRVPSGARAVR